MLGPRTAPTGRLAPHQLIMRGGAPPASGAVCPCLGNGWTCSLIREHVTVTCSAPSRPALVGQRQSWPRCPAGHLGMGPDCAPGSPRGGLACVWAPWPLALTASPAVLSPPCSRFGTKCARCGRQIYASDWVRRARGNAYHLACFACFSCKRQLSTGEEFGLVEEKVLCRIHYDTMIENLKRAAENGTYAERASGSPVRSLRPLRPGFRGLFGYRAW